MIPPSRAHGTDVRPLWASLPALALGLLFVTFGSSGCENKAIGRPCDPQAGDAGAGQAVVNAYALECPSRICLKAAPDNRPEGSYPSPGSMCTAECSSDEDCEDGETGSKSDRAKCKEGWSCAIPTVVGDLCCKKLCVCRDFLLHVNGKVAKVTTPEACNANNPANTCKNLR